MGIAGSNSGNRRNLARDCDSLLPTADLLRLWPPTKAPPYRKKRWLLWLEDTLFLTRLAVQQQLIEPRLANAELIESLCLCATRAFAHLYLERTKESLEHRNL